MNAAIQTVGFFMVAAISVMGIRMVAYWRSLLLHWPRYRQRDHVTTSDLRALPVPFVKVQITTRGSDGSTPVIERGIDNIAKLVGEAPEFYARFVSVEVVTESAEQARYLEAKFADRPFSVEGLVMPADYETKNGTRLKARGMHYAVENRRIGWNRKPGRTFIVHFDEESVMAPSELRKLIAVLSTTEKSILEGPIYYPLEYTDTSVLCRAMEANRPIGCFECREVMETGIPLHLHGSNLVIEEKFENGIGWDIGLLDGQPFIAEDYVFGVKAFVESGREVFGWHGCVLLEQPPFSVKSAFKQRHRWVVGVLQGMKMLQRTEGFTALPGQLRRRLVWGTRFRIGTFALGAPVGCLALALMPWFGSHSVQALFGNSHRGLPPLISVWLGAVGAMWLGSVAVGAFYNVLDTDLSPLERIEEIAKTVAVAPLSGVVESTAAFWAVVQWISGHRTVSWLPTPKTLEADQAAVWGAAA